MNGKFIVVEGFEESSKISSIKQIFKTLNKNNIFNILFSKDPVDTSISEKLKIFIKRKIESKCISDNTELLLYYTEREKLLENIIKPALSLGIWVIGDRDNLSYQAYKGVNKDIDDIFINLLQKYFLVNVKPDLILYLDISPQIVLSKIFKNLKLKNMKKEYLTFFYKIRKLYLELAKKNKNIKIINANIPIEIVHTNITYTVQQWLNTL